MTAIHRLSVVVLSAICCTGCAYDRSFMQLDSNSGVPFFGLQLSVDSGSRPAAAKPTHHEPLTLRFDRADTTHSAADDIITVAQSFHD